MITTQIKNLFKYCFSPLASPIRLRRSFSVGAWGEMKRGANFLIALPIVLLAACSNTNPQAKDGFELKGTLVHAHGGNIYLEKIAPEGISPFDTASINDKGEFLFTPIIKEIGLYRLKIDDKNIATFIFSPNQKITVTGNAHDFSSTYEVEGSPDSKLFKEMNKASSLNYRQRDTLQKQYQAFANLNPGNQARLDSMAIALDQPYSRLVKEHNMYLIDFINKNKKSIAALAAIQQLPIEEFTAVYIDLDKVLYASYPNVSFVKAFHKEVKTKTACAIGSPAPEIKFNTPGGKPLALSSLKGKVVLVDFWASWCGPCRMENPNVVMAYNRYKDKGFDIYSVSLDNDLNRWKAAIEKDKLTWKNHVCDFKGWQSPVVGDYNFNGIPSNVLLDKNGIIIAKNLRGIDLENKLAEVFK